VARRMLIAADVVDEFKSITSCVQDSGAGSYVSHRSAICDLIDMNTPGKCQSLFHRRLPRIGPFAR
jgi:hypothetical protein